MTNTNDLRTRLLAAAFAVAVSAVFFATAIVPASPNGLVMDPDETMLYIAVTRANAVWRMPLPKEGGTFKVGVFVRLSGGLGGPDGAPGGPDLSSLGGLGGNMPKLPPGFQNFMKK